jgi:hypothetical protein
MLEGDRLMDTSNSKVKEAICQVCNKKLDWGRFCREHIVVEFANYKEK